jgi:sec-independent protein translocase protein TatA|tara:strand:- start:2062 stop:2247 length:186 start_codon:yes stop_codon:yes gene_type:complete
MMSIFMAIGPYQIGVIVLVIVLLFGGRKIPELMKGLGGGVKEFKKAIKDDDDDDKTESGEE